MVKHRSLAIGLSVILFAAFLGWVGYSLSLRAGIHLSKGDNAVGGAYRLTTLSEGTATEGDFRGRWVLMWFFDTSCPLNKCVPTLKAMSDASAALSKENIHIAPIAVTLDPRHDEAAELKFYVTHHAPNIIALTGSPNMVEAVAREFHAPVKQIHAPDESSYHQPAPQIIVMDPSGRFAASLPAESSAESLMHSIRMLALKREN